MTDYSRFTAELPARADRLSQALRDKDYAAARTILQDIEHRCEGVRIWLNVQAQLTERQAAPIPRTS